MPKYRIEDTLVDTEQATASYEPSAEQQARRGHIERLYRSKNGKYYKTTLTVEAENLSEMANNAPQISAEWVPNKEAATWLALNDWALPEELKEFEQLTD